jgi:glycosyltransferase involved in cell wall biosynthesis
MNMLNRVTLVLPVHNEERELVEHVRRARSALDRLAGRKWDLVIADNASTDDTWALACDLEGAGQARSIRLEQKGRGGALHAAWMASPSELLAYMDIDLATDLAHLVELLTPLESGEADLVLGSRHAPGAEVLRGWGRTILSHGYNFLARRATGSRVQDHQCGFKALTRAACLDLLPRVRDRGWFFDTELIVLAQQGGWRVREIPVRWNDHPDSRVQIVRTVLSDLGGLWRIRGRGRRQGRRIRGFVFT